MNIFEALKGDGFIKRDYWPAWMCLRKDDFHIVHANGGEKFEFLLNDLIAEDWEVTNYCPAPKKIKGGKNSGNESP